MFQKPFQMPSLLMQRSPFSCFGFRDYKHDLVTSWVDYLGRVRHQMSVNNCWELDTVFIYVFHYSPIETIPWFLWKKSSGSHVHITILCPHYDERFIQDYLPLTSRIHPQYVSYIKGLFLCTYNGVHGVPSKIAFKRRKGDTIKGIVGITYEL